MPSTVPESAWAAELAITLRLACNQGRRHYRGEQGRSPRLPWGGAGIPRSLFSALAAAPSVS